MEPSDMRRKFLGLHNVLRKTVALSFDHLIVTLDLK